MKLDNLNTLSESILVALEQYWEFKLPRSYRMFLLIHNGGEPCKDIFFVKEKQHGSDIRNFLGIYPDKNYNLLYYLKFYNNRIPSNTLPIARDSFGNLILLSVKGPDYGKVYFWDHDWEAEDGVTPDYSNLTLIADNFDEFINNLKSQDEIDL